MNETVTTTKQTVSFGLGQILATPGALNALRDARQTAANLIARHASGDWGEMCAEDKELNDEALTSGGRLMSAYKLTSGVKLWIITEAADDAGYRMATTILLPEEY